ncbi:helix-turn-helix domain-containing protein [Paracoccus sphaerophysae]|uniref:helix-turn-helix domain-containing protein n=1 Tax=Paracoccus sphaerophysae TaxID=690417 RepID=UPI0023533B32|nr:helix-turn-helix domain-containing protein [Paracoccus sphaerophysae]
MRRLVGNNLVRLRRERGVTQEQVEVLSGFSKQYLSGLERGARNPTVVTLYELAQALGKPRGVGQPEADSKWHAHPARRSHPPAHSRLCWAALSEVGLVGAAENGP